MPAQGFKTITVSEQVYLKLEKLAQERYTTIPKIIEMLISKEVNVNE